MKWEIIKEKSEDHWLELRGTDCYGGEEETVWNYYAVAKWDGCIHFYSYYNGYSYGHVCEKDCQCLEEYVHLCNRGNDMITALLELQKVATPYHQEHGHAGDWPEE